MKYKDEYESEIMQPIVWAGMPTKNGVVYTSYVEWLESKYAASRESKSAVPNDLDIHKEAMALYDRIDTMSFKAGAKWAINFKRGIDG